MSRRDWISRTARSQRTLVQVTKKQQRFAVYGEKGAPLRWKDICRLCQKGLKAATSGSGQIEISVAHEIFPILSSALSESARNAFDRAAGFSTKSRASAWRGALRWAEKNARSQGHDALVSKKYPFKVKVTKPKGKQNCPSQGDPGQQTGRDGESASGVELSLVDASFLPPGAAVDHSVVDVAPDEGESEAAQPPSQGGGKSLGSGEPSSASGGASGSDGASPTPGQQEAQSKAGGGGETSEKNRELNPAEGPASAKGAEQPDGEAQAEKPGGAQPSDCESHGNCGESGLSHHPTLCDCPECQQETDGMMDGLTEGAAGLLGEAPSPKPSMLDVASAMGRAGAPLVNAKGRRVRERKREREGFLPHTPGPAYGGRYGFSPQIKVYAEKSVAPAKQVLAALERMTKRWEPVGATGRQSFRIAPKRLAIECEGALRVGRARKREMAPQVFVVMVDTSGSCAHVSTPLMGAATAMAKIDPRVIVVEYSNTTYVAAFGSRRDLVEKINRAGGLSERRIQYSFNDFDIEVWKTIAGIRPAIVLASGDDHGCAVYQGLVKDNVRLVVATSQGPDYQRLWSFVPPDVRWRVTSPDSLAKAMDAIGPRT